MRSNWARFAFDIIKKGKEVCWWSSMMLLSARSFTSLYRKQQRRRWNIKSWCCSLFNMQSAVWSGREGLLLVKTQAQGKIPSCLLPYTQVELWGSSSGPKAYALCYIIMEGSVDTQQEQRCWWFFDAFVGKPLTVHSSVLLHRTYTSFYTALLHASSTKEED